MPITCPTCTATNPDNQDICVSCGRPLEVQIIQKLSAQPHGVAQSSSAISSLSQPPPVWAQSTRQIRRSSRAVMLCWILTMIGCLMLVESPRLPWIITSDVSGVMAINGFNTITTLPNSDTVLSEIQALGIVMPDLAAQAASDAGSSDTIVIPSLSAIPWDSGGTDDNAKGGIFILVLAGIALFLALWTIGGDIDRRRSMALSAFLNAGLACFSVILSLVTTAQSVSATTGSSLGGGLFVGLLGAVMAMGGSIFLYRALGIVKLNAA